MSSRRLALAAAVAGLLALPPGEAPSPAAADDQRPGVAVPSSESLDRCAALAASGGEAAGPEETVVLSLNATGTCDGGPRGCSFTY